MSCKNLLINEGEKNYFVHNRKKYKNRKIEKKETAQENSKALFKLQNKKNDALQFRLLQLNQRIISDLGYYLKHRHNKKQVKKVQNSN